VKTAAIIPARGGSKRVLGKNLRMLGGVSLVERAIATATICDDAWVSTDDARIAEVASRAGARVVMRPAHLATDTSPTEDTIKHWWRSLRSGERPDVIMLLQPSTPVFDLEHPRAALAAMVSGGYDSIVGVTVEAHHAFAGRLYPREDGLPEWRPHRPIMTRPRTQDVRAQGHENGAFWLFTAEHWQRTGCRQGGDCRAWAMGRYDSIDIDTMADLRIAEVIESERRADYALHELNAEAQAMGEYR
jgi:CMP-N-acetylneuraminic acid synthetase